MSDAGTAVVLLAESSGVGEARRVGARIAERLGLTANARGNLAIVLTELGNNIIRHGESGLIVFHASGGALEVTTIDRGPGIPDVSRALQDGYSTAGTPGEGLGAISRLSDEFDLYSTPGAGTVISCRFNAPPPDAAPAHQSSGIAVPKHGETVCGDGWSAHHEKARSVVVVADGLGHGIQAAEASREAVRVFDEDPAADPVEMLERMHGALRKTRGAAVAVAEVDRAEGTVRYAGVGNIAGAVLAPDGTGRRMISYNGIVGHEVRKISQVEYPWTQSSLLVMHSDGLSSTWRLEGYRGLLTRHPALVAGVLYRDYQRGTDDATVVVSR